MDLYDNYTIYPDKHVGRAEIRLNTLETMPETFTSYYEFWDKKLSSGASSSIGRERAAVNNVGALHAKIIYNYLRSSNVIDEGLNLGNIKEVRKDIEGATNLMTEEQLAAEFKRHLQFQRERKKSKGSIRFRKYEESDDMQNNGLDYPDESDYDDYDDYDEIAMNRDDDEEDDVTGSLMQPLKLSKKRADTSDYGALKHDVKDNNDQEDEEFGDMVAAPDLKRSSSSSASSWYSFSTSSTQPTRPKRTPSMTKNNTRTLPEDSDKVAAAEKSGSWTSSTDISQVIRTIGKLLATFGQGFELSNIQVLTGFTVLEKFYSDLPRNRTWELVEDLSEIDNAARFWKFSIASYGWKGLNFIGKGNGIISDAMREHSDAKSIIEYLMIPKEDLLAYEFRSAEAFRPSYFIARDRFTNSIVLSIRGTMVSL